MKKLMINTNMKRNLGVGLAVVLAVLTVGSAKILRSTKSVGPTSSQAATSFSCETGVNVVVPTPAVDPCIGKIDVMLVTDRSGSMNSLDGTKRKIDWAREAIVAFVDEMTKNNEAGVKLAQAKSTALPQVRVGLVSINKYGTSTGQTYERSVVDVPLQVISTGGTVIKNLMTKTQSWKYAWDVFRTPSGSLFSGDGTCVQCGLRLAGNQMKTSSTDATVVRYVILLSDGLANTRWSDDPSDNSLARKAAVDEAIALRNSLLVSQRTIGFGSSGAINEPTLKGIAADWMNYSYKPNGSSWAAAFRTEADFMCGTDAVKRVAITPDRDTYVDKASPNTGFGTAVDHLKSRGASGVKNRVVYMQFPFAGLKGRQVQNVEFLIVPSDQSGAQQTLRFGT